MENIIITIGADELILWLRKNGKAQGVKNNHLGTKICILIKQLAGVDPIEEDKPVYWDTRDGAKNIDDYNLPKTAAQYEIAIDKLSCIYDELFTW